MNFRELNEAELARLDDEELIAYLCRARAAGRDDAALLATQILAFAQQRSVIAWFYNHLGSKGDMVVEELAAVTLRDAVKWAASFEGKTAAEFRAGVFTIARRRRVDFLRKKEVDTISFVFEGSQGDEEREFGSGDPIESIDQASVFNQAFGELRKNSHKLVILLGMHGYSHREIAEKVVSQFEASDDDPMTENNVAKILSRHRKRIDELNAEVDDPSAEPRDDD